MNLDYEIKKILLEYNKPISDFMLIQDHANDNSLEDSEIINFTKTYANGDYPLQYLVGHEYFFDKKIFLSEDVLIPRMETEEVVLEAVKRIKEEYNPREPIKILDLCTGSGAIVVGLNKFLSEYEVEYYASDISKAALEIAKINFKMHNIKVNIVQSDLLDGFKDQNIYFDVIVSNPPYIDVQGQYDENVFKYEPHIALFANDGGLEMYNRIFYDIKNVVEKKFILCLEIGYDQREALTKMMKKLQYIKNFDIIYDINGLDRIFIADGVIDDREY